MLELIESNLSYYTTLVYNYFGYLSLSLSLSWKILDTLYTVCPTKHNNRKLLWDSLGAAARYLSMYYIQCVPQNITIENYSGIL